MGLTVLLVFLRLEIALDGDTVAFLQEVEGSSVLVLAPHLDVEECALALVQRPKRATDALLNLLILAS